jgi:hypothetical protein
MDYYMNGMQLTEGQKIVLLDMAYQCPYTYGEIVYAARSLMTQFDYDLIYYLSLCEIDFSQRLSENSQLNQETDPEVKVYPNPATTYITIELINFDLTESNVVIEIYSVDGKLNITESRPLLSMMTLDVGILKQGIYSYSIRTEKNSFKGVLLIK